MNKQTSLEFAEETRYYIEMITSVAGGGGGGGGGQ